METPPVVACYNQFFQQERQRQFFQENINKCASDTKPRTKNPPTFNAILENTALPPNNGRKPNHDTYQRHNSTK